jgi:hypothetical protein
MVACDYCRFGDSFCSDLCLGVVFGLLFKLGWTWSWRHISRESERSSTCVHTFFSELGFDKRRTLGV